jgi:hypothetical protein
VSYSGLVETVLHDGVARAPAMPEIRRLHNIQLFQISPDNDRPQ